LVGDNQLISPYHHTQIALMVALSLISVACSKTEVERPESATKPLNTDAGSLQETGLAPKPPIREAFGLPLPPEIMTVIPGPHAVTVKTPMDLDELEGFFKSRLVDFEILRPRAKIQVIGLHEGSPQVNGTFFWARNGGYTRLEYRPGRTAPAVEEAGAQGQIAQKKTTRADRRPRKHVVGSAVVEKTPQGTHFAPEARYGKPYTPPKGSPLNTQDNRANFGKPYGEWIAH
jgi:hypothetical protein